MEKPDNKSIFFNQRMERIQELAKEASAIMEEASVLAAPKKRVAILTPGMTSPVAPGVTPTAVAAPAAAAPAAAAPAAAPAAPPAPPKKLLSGPRLKKSAAAPAPTLLEQAASAVEGVVEAAASVLPATTAAPAPPPAPSLKPRIKRVPKEPTDFATFVKSRHKDPSRYVFTKEGNIAIKDGERLKPIATLSTYRKPTATEMGELEAAQEATLEEILKNIETTKKELRDAIMTYRSAGDGADVVVSLNERISELMRQKSTIEYPLRWLEVNRRENIADILLDEEFEKRKTQYEVIYLKRRGKTLQDEYVRRYEEGDETAQAALSAVRKGMSVFSSKEDENAMLADNWVAEFVVDGVQYSSALQAYYAIKASALGQEDVRAKMMDTRSSKKLRRYVDTLLGKDTEDWLKQREDVLFKIHLAKFQQHPELAKALEKTGNNRLVYANPVEKELGIGLDRADPRLDEGRWLGKNLLGEVLMKVRARLREEGGASAAAGAPAAPSERAITEAEDLARTKAIIARRTKAKRGGF